MPEATPTPRVEELKLNRHYRFMYENFAVLTQHHGAYLILEKDGDDLLGICFSYHRNCRYGGPNDEARGGHPLARFGLRWYGLYEVHNSPWIHDMMVANRVHDRHRDSLFEGLRHFIACFKDVMFECVCKEMCEIRISSQEFNALLAEQIHYLD